MTDEAIFRIELAERLHYSQGKRKKVPWRHGYLALREQCSSSTVETYQELHFNAYDKRLDGIGPVTSYVRMILEDEYEAENLNFTTVFVGRESDIIPRWNHGLEYAQQVKDAGVLMDYGHKLNPRALNCYQLIEDTAAAMGLYLDPHLRLSKAGSQARKLSVKPRSIFSFASLPESGGAAEEVINAAWVKNKALVDRLPAPEILEARHLQRAQMIREF